ncbi:uncharacterized protein LOC121737951 [Aricia agestis]|uniref:uncharacterized protein LOC121737951 n=1 Tax=Aricia agestis TaxID=91739 RepID=UPI001C202ACC|nr:uncharacterized protein LOC121737951 [Aricia agestis]
MQGEETHAHDFPTHAAAAAAAAPAVRSLIANENVEELIDEVEKRPALYKKDLKHYSDINVKEKLWEEVCAIVIHNWSELNAYEKREKGRSVKKKWNNLRTCFARELKAQKSIKSGQVASKRRPYVYFERMLFLVPCMESRPAEGSIETSESNQNYTDLSEEAHPHRQRKRKAKQGEFDEQLLNAHHSKEHILNARHSKEQLLNARHSKEQLLNARHSKEQLLNAHHSKEQLLNAHHSKEQLLNAHHSKEQLLNAHNCKEDADTNYCLSLVPFMKELTADEKLEVRIHILKMFQDIKKKRQLQNISFIQPDTSQSQVTRRATPSTSVRIISDQIIKSKHSRRRPSRPLHTTNQTFTSQPLTASLVSQQQYNIAEPYPLTSPSSESQTPPPQYDSDIIPYWPNYSESDSELIDL